MMDKFFWVNPGINMKEIVDSMQLDSNQLIAQLRLGGIAATLEVRGSVRVLWDENGDPINGDPEIYRYPSEFPDELKALIAKGYDPETHDSYDNDPRVYVDENNWFELFVWNEYNGELLDNDVVDIEGKDEEALYKMLLDAIMYRGTDY